MRNVMVLNRQGYNFRSYKIDNVSKETWLKKLNK